LQFLNGHLQIPDTHDHLRVLKISILPLNFLKVSAPNFALLDRNVLTRSKFSDNFLTAQNLGRPHYNACDSWKVAVSQLLPFSNFANTK